MRVTLIIPESGFMLDERVFPSLGVLRVAAVLERDGIDVSVVDLSGRDDASADFPQADVYGLTATTPQMPAAARIVQRLRTRAPRARIVLGGPHVTLMQAAARLERKRGIESRACVAMADLAAVFDVLVCGDGELAIHAALAPDAPSLIDADDPKSHLFLTREDLDDLPFPARHLIDLSTYRFLIDGVPATSLIAQLGCPFGCGFCGGRNSPFLRRVRTRSSQSVVDEMLALHNAYGLRGFMFLDDELNVNKAFPELLTAIAEAQRQRGLRFQLRGLLKAELFTDAMAAAMVTAGFRQVLIGFESGDPRMLLNMNKHATRDDNTRAVAIARRHGLSVKALMSIGHPGESHRSIAATRDWLLTVRPDEFDVSIITVYPGTPYHDEAVEVLPGIWTYTAPKTGDTLHARAFDQFSDVPFYKGIPEAYESFVSTDYLTAEELVTARDNLETEIRERLHIPWPTSAAERQYEHSMGSR